MIRLLVLLMLMLGLAGPARAQLPETEAEATTVEEIVVTARRAGAPVWRVADADTTVVIVGAIRGLPDQEGWRPEALTQAVALADRVLFPQEARFSPADFVRMIFRGGDLVYLPDDQTLDALLTPATWPALRLWRRRPTCRAAGAACGPGCCPTP